MGEQADYFRAIQAHRQQEHADQKQHNTAIIQKSGLIFRGTNNGECLVLRERGKPAIDFYPSSGRWREVGPSKRNHTGGAESFLQWYGEQKA